MSSSYLPFTLMVVKQRKQAHEKELGRTNTRARPNFDKSRQWGSFPRIPCSDTADPTYSLEHKSKNSRGELEIGKIMTESSFEVVENIILLGHKGMYFVERFLGEGTFGKVAKCTNLSTNEEVAIKIIKNGFNKTAKDEIKALTEISKLDAHKYSLVKFVEWFHYNSHVCIVFEMLDQSLFDFMKDRSSHPLFLHEIRAIAWQLLISLKGLKSINLVHCDIKLDNIMLVNQVSEPFRVKLIDFGLASKTTDIQMGTRLQNICFRAPEVILGLPLDERLDMWTVGYVLALLYTGFYILPRDSEFNIIRAMVEMHGMPDNECLDQGLYTNKFFTKTEENSKVVWKLDTPEQQSKKTGEQVKDKLDCWSFDNLKDVYYKQTKIKEVEQLIDLLKRMLEVDPNKRISPNDALRHPFFNLEKKTKDILIRMTVKRFSRK
uniref:Protein kinase domain-containing protein n=1 Tax=Oryzias latipes TaxID=8090 RepID=A0A3P9H325_ORYLA